MMKQHGLSVTQTIRLEAAKKLAKSLEQSILQTFNSAEKVTGQEDYLKGPSLNELKKVK